MRGAIVVAAIALLATQQPEASTGRVSGWTVSPASEPIPNVTVVLACPPLRVQTTRSDAAGRFEFQSPEGSCRLITRSDIYVEATYNGPPGSGSYGITVQPGSRQDGIELQLVKGALITGVISAPGGASVEGIRFQAVRRDISNGVSRLVPLSYAPLREGGQYRTATLAPGVYYIRASPPPAGTAVSTPNVGPTYFPGTTDVARATPITVKAGDVQRADFALAPARTYTVNGVVTDEQGNPRREASIAIDADDGLAWIRATGRTDAEGRFSIRGLTDGRYVLHATRPRAADRPMQSGEVHFDVTGGDVDHLLVRTAVR
jgi:hypothetical protein